MVDFSDSVEELNISKEKSKGFFSVIRKLPSTFKRN